MTLKAKTGKNTHRSHKTEEAIKELKKEELRLINFQINNELRKKFKIKTLENGEDMKTVLTKYIERYVDGKK